MAEDRDELLRVADGIGRQLTREAIWHSDWCNWVGAEPRELLGDAKAYGALTYQALTSDLYSGTSGSAVLFLAELSRRTGDGEARRTALGAIRQTMSRLDTIRPEVRLGLFRPAGLASPTPRQGLPPPLGTARWRRRPPACCSVRPPRWLIGSSSTWCPAGRAIAALLALRPLLTEADLLDFAMRLGDDLLDTAVVSEIGCSWRDPQSRNRHNLTGFSHGTSGVASALLELRVASGDPRYGFAAESAFEYERHWFNPEAGNWPDFREQSYAGRRARQGPACATFWCHGAPALHCRSTCLCVAWRRTVSPRSDGGACHHPAQHRCGPAGRQGQLLALPRTGRQQRVAALRIRDAGAGFRRSHDRQPRRRASRSGAIRLDRRAVAVWHTVGGESGSDARAGRHRSLLSPSARSGDPLDSDPPRRRGRSRARTVTGRLTVQRRVATPTGFSSQPSVATVASA